MDGKANQAVIRFLASLAGVPVSAMRIVNGAAHSTKRAEIEGVTSEQLERAILDSHGPRKNPGRSATPES